MISLVQLAVISSAPIILQPRNSSPLTLQFSVQHTLNPATLPQDSDAIQDKAITVDVKNYYTKYLAELSIGSNGQKVQVSLDTGSSDLWVPASGTTSSYGTFDKSKSTTYKKVGDGFSISYSDKTGASGEWGSDLVSIGSNLQLKNLDFGLGTTQTAAQGILGIGLQALEMGINGKKYDNLPMALKSQGLIDRVSYALFLDGQENTCGTVSFGGFDNTKFDGDLETVPIVPVENFIVDGKPSKLYVNLDSVKQSGNSFSDKSYPALLDSGLTLVKFPPAVYQAIVSKYGTKGQATGGLYNIDCAATGDPLEFKFNNKVILVPFTNFIYKVSDNSCQLGIKSNTADLFSLGDEFLRAAYVYYDLEAYTVGIAQSK